MGESFTSGGMSLLDQVMGLASIVFVFLFLIRTYPKIEHLLIARLEGSMKREAGDKSDQPLAQVFFQFDHSSVDEWLLWIKSQSIESKKIAFDRLVGYIRKPATEIGAVISEVVKAVHAFSSVESYDVILELLHNTRLTWGQCKCVDLYYGEAAKALVSLDAKRAQADLKAELERIKIKLDSLECQVYLVRALSGTNPTEAMRAFWVDSLLDARLNFKVKQEVLRSLTRYSADKQNDVYSQVLQHYIKNEMDELEDTDAEILEEIFNKSISFWSGSFDDVWYLAVNASECEWLTSLFTQLILGVLEDSDLELKDEQIEELLSTDEPVRSIFVEALAKRFDLTEDELSILNNKVDTREFKTYDEIIKVEQFDESKHVLTDLQAPYNTLEETVLAKADKNNSSANVAVITGTAHLAKIYVVRALAANIGMSFIYTDASALISSVKFISDLRNKIEESKPCIVYMDNLYDILNNQFNDDQIKNLRTLNKVVSQFASQPSVNFVGNLNLDLESIESEEYSHLKRALDEPLRGSYWLALDIDEPGIEERRKIFNNFVKKLKPERIDDSSGLDALVNFNAKASFLEYINYLRDFFEASLLVKGKLEAPEGEEVISIDYSQV